MNRRRFLQVLGLAPLAAKSYFFLGGVLRPHYRLITFDRLPFDKLVLEKWSAKVIEHLFSENPFLKDLRKISGMPAL